MKSWPVWDKPLLWNPQDPALEDEARLDLMGSAGQELCYKSLSLWWYVKKCRICFLWVQFLLLTNWVWMDFSYQRRIYLGACWEDECRVTFLLGQMEEIARLVSQIHMMLQAPYTWGWQELLNCIINFFDFSSCPLVVFDLLTVLCSELWQSGALHEIGIHILETGALYPRAIALSWEFGWQRTELCWLVGQRNGFLLWKAKSSVCFLELSPVRGRVFLGQSNAMLEGTEEVLGRNHKASIFAFSRSYSKQNQLFLHLLLFSR